MPQPINVDLDTIYRNWRLYLKSHSAAEHFGMVFDATRKAEFPYANLSLIGRSTNGSDLEGDESTIMLTFETEAYINNNKYLTAYAIDNASAEFFLNLGFRRVGETALIRVSNTVFKVTSRFTLNHFNGTFLNPLDSII